MIFLEVELNYNQKMDNLEDNVYHNDLNDLEMRGFSNSDIKNKLFHQINEMFYSLSSFCCYFQFTKCTCLCLYSLYRFSPVP